MKRLCIVLFALFLFLSHNIALQVSNPCDGASYCEVNILIFLFNLIFIHVKVPKVYPSLLLLHLLEKDDPNLRLSLKHLGDPEPENIQEN